MENGLESAGAPKAVWQIGDSSINVYNQYTPSELSIRDNKPLKEIIIFKQDTLLDSE